MSRFWSVAMLSVAALVANGIPAVAEVIIQPDEAASHDGFAYELAQLQNANVNDPMFGFNSLLTAGKTGTGHDTQAFLKFDLSSISFPATEVASAKLRLFAIPASQGLGENPDATHQVTFDAFAAQNAVEFDTVSWAGRPTLAATSSGQATQAAVNVEVLVDITQLVKDWLSGSLTNNGLGVVQQNILLGPGGQHVIGVFASSANGTAANWPSLIVTQVTAVPEPASIVLGLFAVPALAWAARRRFARA